MEFHHPPPTENFDDSPYTQTASSKFRFIFVKRCVIGLVYRLHIAIAVWQPSVAKKKLFGKTHRGDCNNSPLSEDEG